MYKDINTYQYININIKVNMYENIQIYKYNPHTPSIRTSYASIKEYSGGGGPELLMTKVHVSCGQS
jgi:hypothetical protein